MRQRKNSPARNRTSDLRIPHSDALPLSLRSGVLFLKGTQNFLFHARDKAKRHLSQYSLLFHGHLFSREPLKKSRMCHLILNADLFRLIRSVISLQVSRHPFNQSVAPLKLSTSGSVTSFCSRRRILTMAS